MLRINQTLAAFSWNEKKTWTFNNLLTFITFILYKYKMKCRVKNESMSEKTLRQRLKCELCTENAVLTNINQIKYDIYYRMGESL